MKSKKHGKRGDMALKIDISKAYDLKMGFEGRWVDWMMLCVTRVRYSIQVNGGLVGPIQPKRELRTRRSTITLTLYHVCRGTVS